MIHLDHTIVSATDPDRSALFLAETLGLPAPEKLGHFTAVRVGDTTLDFYRAEGEIHAQHYAFRVSEVEFDDILGRIRERGLDYWADPYQRKAGQINTWDGGRGVYWEDPDGHLLEIITRSYGTGGSTTDKPHPLLDDTPD